MAYDILRPRRDDECGVQDIWEAFCLSKGHPSFITSFRDNHFNNFFEAAASLHFYSAEIERCLGDYARNRNKKEEVVLSDSRDEMTGHHIIALGLLFFHLTDLHLIIILLKNCFPIFSQINVPQQKHKFK